MLLVVSLLFQQLTLAAFACMPMPAAHDHAMASHATMGEACAEAGMGQAPHAAPLCEKCCSPDRMLAAAQVALQVPALGLPPVAFALLAPQPAGSPTPATDVAIARSDQPPRLRYCRLLI